MFFVDLRLVFITCNKLQINPNELPKKVFCQQDLKTEFFAVLTKKNIGNKKNLCDKMII